MKKSEQILVNNEVVKYFNKVCKEFAIEENLSSYEKVCKLCYELPYNKRERLHSCNASFITFHHKIFLISYSTIVAIYDCTEDKLYDILRLVYGYTATSSQHISKFSKLVGASETITYKDV